MTNSRAKGARGELEVSALIREYGFEARRGQQFSGIGESPDVVHSLEGYHIEVKYLADYKLHVLMGKEVDSWVAQAFRDAKGLQPIIFHRGARGEWFVITFGMDLTSYSPDKPVWVWNPRERSIQTARQFLTRQREWAEKRREIHEASN